MTFSNPFPFVIAMWTPDDTVLFYKSRKKWFSDPRPAAHLTDRDASRAIKQLVKLFTVHLEIVRFDKAMQLFKEGKRRGDIRSLAGPDEPGVPTLTARTAPQGKHG